MDVRDSPEQTELRRSARQLANELGPTTVIGLDDSVRRKRLAQAVREAGWLELRNDDGAEEGEGTPLAGGSEAAIIAEALGEAVADVAFAGPVMAADLARRAGCDPVDDAVVAFHPDLIRPGEVSDSTTSVTTEPLYAIDCAADRAVAFALQPTEGGFRLASVLAEEDAEGTDLTRRIRPIPAGASIRALDNQRRALTRDDLDAWTALGLAIGSADLIGVMRGVLDISVTYAADRRQYGVPVGSFQAVQHLLAEARCLVEGAFSASLYASWAVDHLEPSEALMAGRVAKAYSARAARTVCETAVQVHGGMGNTWECVVHVYLRRALLSSSWFGDESEQLLQIQRRRLGVTDGLS